MVKDLYELDSSLSDLEIACNKAKTMCSDLKDSYFGTTNPENYLLRSRYEEAGVKTQILMDYLFEMKVSLEDLRGKVEKEFENVNCKTA